MLRPSATFTTDRRHHTRLPIGSLTFIEFDEGNGGLILDLSEDGATVQAAEILVGGFFQRVRFRLPRAEGWIETSGKVVWQRPSQKEAGIQFVHMPEDTRHQIKNWTYSETFRPSTPTKNGRFKIVWEDEDPSPTSVPATARKQASSFGYDPAMFPSERSIATVPTDPVDRKKMLSGDFNISTNLDESLEQTGGPFVGADGPLITEVDPLMRLDDAPKPAVPESAVSRKRASWERQRASRLGETPDSGAPQWTPALSESTGTPSEAEPMEDPGTIHSISRSSKIEPNHHATRTTGRIPTSECLPNSACLGDYGRDQLDSRMPPSTSKGWALPAVIALATGLGLGIFLMQEPWNSKSVVAHLEAPAVERIADSSHAGVSKAGETGSRPPDAASRTQNAPATLALPSLPSPGGFSKRANHWPSAPKRVTLGLTEVDQQGPALSPSSLPNHPKLSLLPTEIDESLVGASRPRVAEGGSIERPLPPAANAQASSPPPAAPNDRTLDAYATENQRATIQPFERWQRFVPPPQHSQTADAAVVQTASVVPVALEISQSGSGTVAISSHFHAIREVPSPESQPPQVGGNLRIGHLISIRQPVYPQNAASLRIEGAVKLRAIVGRDGTVRAVELVGGPLELVPAATSAVGNWRYEQTLLDGQPVESEEDITLSFRLTNFAASPR